MSEIKKEQHESHEKCEPKDSDDKNVRKEADREIGSLSDQIKQHRKEQHESGRSYATDNKNGIASAKDLLGDFAHQQLLAEKPNTQEQAYKNAGYGNPEHPIGKPLTNPQESLPIGKLVSSSEENLPYGSSRINYESEKHGDSLLLKINLSTPSEKIENTGNTPSPQHNERLKQFESATSQLLDTAGERFGKDKIAAMNIAKDDLGSSVSALLLGPDICKLMGPEQTREFGKRLLVFGIAPAFGAANEAHTQITQNLQDTIHEGASNALIGTAIGAALEKAHPAVFATVAVGGTGWMINDQLNSPEHKARNEELQNISSKISSASNADLLNFCDQTRQTLGPDLYKAAFAVATAGPALPGNTLAAGAKEELANNLAKTDLHDVAKSLNNITHDAWQSLTSIFEPKPKLRPATATATGPALEPRFGITKAEHFFAMSSPTAEEKSLANDLGRSAANKLDATAVETTAIEKLPHSAEQKALSDAPLTLGKKLEAGQSMQEMWRGEIARADGKQPVIWRKMQYPERFEKELQCQELSRQLNIGTEFPTTVRRPHPTTGADGYLQKAGTPLSDWLDKALSSRPGFSAARSREQNIESLLKVDRDFRNQMESALVERLIFADNDYTADNFVVQTAGKLKVQNIDPAFALPENPKVLAEAGESMAPKLSALKEMGDMQTIINYFGKENKPFNINIQLGLRKFIDAFDNAEGRTKLANMGLNDFQTELLLTRARWFNQNKKFPPLKVPGKF